MSIIPLEQIDVRAIKRRLPENVLNWLEANPNKVCVAGGFLRSVVAGEPVQDIDVFISGADDVEPAIYALRHGQGQTRKFTRSQNAVTIFSKPIIQIVTRWKFASPEAVIDSFDFTIASAAFWFNGKDFVAMAHTRFYADLAAKRLHYLSPVRAEDAGGSMLRVLKFYQRGYRIPLDSLARVIGRICGGVKWDTMSRFDEPFVSKVIAGLLFEVDPNANHDNFFLPSEDPTLTEAETEGEGENNHE